MTKTNKSPLTPGQIAHKKWQKENRASLAVNREKEAARRLTVPHIREWRRYFLLGKFMDTRIFSDEDRVYYYAGTQEWVKPKDKDLYNLPSPATVAPATASVPVPWNTITPAEWDAMSKHERLNAIIAGKKVDGEPAGGE